MMTLVQQFEETEFRAQMLAGQQQLIYEVNRGFEAMTRNQEEIINSLSAVKKNLAMSNVLSTMNFCVNLGTQRKIDYQNKIMERRKRLKQLKHIRNMLKLKTSVSIVGII